MPENHDHDQHSQPVSDHHNCGNLFGCGDEKGTGILRSDIQEAASNRRGMDRLLHMDELDQEPLDGYLSARGRARRKLLRASSFMGVLAAVGPWFSNLAFAEQKSARNKATSRSTATKAMYTQLNPTIKPSGSAFTILRCRPS